MEIYSIGFTQKTAEQFFGLLKRHGIAQLLDVRLNNVSQLAGFAKRGDLEFFLKQICGAVYRHEPLLAPTQQMLDDYKKKKGGWPPYEARFLSLMQERRVETALGRGVFSLPTALLCSEATAAHCHRRLVLEYLAGKWGGVEITHL